MDRVRSFLRTSRGGGYAALVGTIFESMAHRMISTVGCHGELRCLEPTNKRKRDADQYETSGIKIRMGPLERVIFEKFDDIQWNKYNVPLARNFAAVDSLVPSEGLLLQMTISPRHAIKLAMLEQLKKSGKFDKHLEMNATAKLIFVVDISVYDEFKFQHYKTAAGTESVLHPGWVTQYVFGIDIPEQLGQLREDDEAAFQKITTWDTDERMLNIVRPANHSVAEACNFLIIFLTLQVKIPTRQ